MLLAHIVTTSMLRDFVQEGKRSRNRSLLKCGLMKKFANSQARRQIQAFASAKNAKHGAYPHSAQKMGIKRLYLQSAATQKHSYSSFCLKDLGINSRFLLLLSLVFHACFQRSCLVRRADFGAVHFAHVSVARIAAGLIPSLVVTKNCFYEELLFAVVEEQHTAHKRKW